MKHTFATESTERIICVCVSIIKSKINKSTRLLMLMFVLEIEICSKNIGRLRSCLNIFHICLCVWMGPLETFN